MAIMAQTLLPQALSSRASMQCNIMLRKETAMYSILDEFIEQAYPGQYHQLLHIGPARCGSIQQVFSLGNTTCTKKQQYKNNYNQENDNYSLIAFACATSQLPVTTL